MALSLWHCDLEFLETRRTEGLNNIKSKKEFAPDGLDTLPNISCICFQRLEYFIRPNN